MRETEARKTVIVDNPTSVQDAFLKAVKEYCRQMIECSEEIFTDPELELEAVFEDMKIKPRVWEGFQFHGLPMVEDQ